ncbi:MAG TPA: hypothetical protein VGA78_10810 [Gemmatimonadales bacterium]
MSTLVFTAGVLALLAPADTLSPDLASLPPAKVSVNEKVREIVIELPGIPLPAHTGHHGGGGGYPPVVRAEIPLDVSLYGFRVEVVDSEGRQLPSELIHHFNLIDPNNRELFLPISRRILAAGKETGAQRLPRFFFGVPMKQGDLVVASAMLHNPTETDYADARVRLVLSYVPGNKWYPVFHGYTWQLDVAFPVGDKSFALPPGKSSRSYEARPSIPGKIVALGGHMHEMGTLIELIEVESGKVLWSASPVLDAERNVTAIPVGKLYGWFKVGLPIRPDRRYRVTVHYDNTTVAPVEAGGMGVIGGLFVPEKGAAWPAAEKNDPLYVQDALHYLRVKRETMAGHNH